MASFVLRDASIMGIVSAVPSRTEGLGGLISLCGEEDARRISDSTGVRLRHISGATVCASDLCFHAAVRLMEELAWPRDSVDALIFVSQTGDFILPATSCCLHGRLKLSKHCAAFDICMGCSGYVYGLWNAACLIAGGCRKVLLLVGDTISKLVSPMDKATMSLFGDAGTATAMGHSDGERMCFELGTDGADTEHLIVPAGGFRRRCDTQTGARTMREDGSSRSDEDLFMDGAEIFTFTIREVPRMITRVLATASWSQDEVDAFVFHQANRFILEYLTKKMKLRHDKVSFSLDKYGNTSCASIPLTISSVLHNTVASHKNRLLLGGFGVGFSWGAAAVEVGPIIAPEVEVVA